MKLVILAGSLGTRLSEETDARPKPMVEIGGRPILWYIMKHGALLVKFRNSRASTDAVGGFSIPIPELKVV
jgi:NDP-sugar pyrophosphorylase family protein